MNIDMTSFIIFCLPVDLSMNIKHVKIDSVFISGANFTQFVAKKHTSLSYLFSIKGPKN